MANEFTAIGTIEAGTAHLFPTPYVPHALIFITLFSGVSDSDLKIAQRLRAEQRGP